jgi:hypothetical protein
MTISPTPATRRPWITPCVKTLSTSSAEAGLVAINPEGDAKGS